MSVDMRDRLENNGVSEIPGFVGIIILPHSLQIMHAFYQQNWTKLRLNPPLLQAVPLNGGRRTLLAIKHLP